MNKLSRSGLISAVLDLNMQNPGPGAIQDAFAGEQAEILAYIQELEGGNERLKEERTFLRTLALNIWHALRRNGALVPAAVRETLLEAVPHLYR